MPIDVYLESRKRLHAWLEEGALLVMPGMLKHAYHPYTEQRHALTEVEYLTHMDPPPNFVGDGFHVDTWCKGNDRLVLSFHAGERDDSRSASAEMHWMKEVSHAIIEVFASRGAVYCAAYSWAERLHRNLLEVPTPWAPRPSTSPLGKDIDRYIPGLYWLNYLSDDYAQARGVDVGAVARELDGECERLGNGTLLTLYDSPARWSDHAERIDDFLQAHPSFFSLRHVPRRVIHTPMELNDYMRTVGKEWP